MMRGKVLLIDQYNKIGGGQSVLIDLVNAFNTLNFNCTIAIPRGGFIENNVQNAAFYYLPDLKLNNKKKSVLDFFRLLFHYLSVWGIIKSVIKTNIVYVNGPRYFIMFYLCSFFIKRKFIYHVHLDFANSGKFILKLLSKQKNTHALVFTSNYLLTEFLSYHQHITVNEVNKLHVVEPGIAKKFDLLEFKDRFDMDTTNFNFMSVGRVYSGKGFELIIELAGFYQQHTFYIVGDAVDDSVEYYNLLKSKAPKNVHFAGSSNNIPLLVSEKNIHFSIVPSEVNEAFGIVAIELMMCSCITLVRERGGLKEISLKTKAVLFDDIDSLKKVIDEITLYNPDVKRELAFAQYSNTKILYSSGVFIKKIDKLVAI